MRRTTVHDSYVGSSAVLWRHGQVPPSGTGNVGARKGFTLIEVVVAMAILVIVVLAMLSSYSFFYSSVTNLRLQSIGENLAQLQLEDVRNMGIGSFKVVLGTNWEDTAEAPKDSGWPARFPENYNCPNYPPAELFYTYDISTPSSITSSTPSTETWYCYYTGTRAANPSAPMDPSNLPAWNTTDASGNSIPVTPRLMVGFPGDSNVLASVKYFNSPSGYVPFQYDSGKRDADFFLERLTSFSISGVSSSSPSNLVLPDTITVAPSPSAPGEYTLDISKWTYPYFKKRVTITDESPGESEPARKLYEVAVTVYWTGTANGAQKSYTVKQKVSFEGQVK